MRIMRYSCWSSEEQYTLSGFQPEVETPKMTSFVGLLYVIADGIVSMLSAMWAVGMHLMMELLLLLLLIAVIEVIRSFLHFVVQLLVIAISIILGVVVYVATFFVDAGRIMFGEPLEQAFAWQQITMLWINSYLPRE